MFFRMIVSPRPSYAAVIDVIGYDVGVVGKSHVEDHILAVLGHNLLVQQLLHFRVRADFAISSRVEGIINAADSQLALVPFSRDRFPATAELRAVNWAQLIAAESHRFLQIGFEGAIDGSDMKDS